MTINATDPSAVTPSTVVRFQSGDLVDVTIRGARVTTPRLGFGDVLTLAYEEVEPGVFATIELRHPRAGSVTIERAVPTNWPPQQGDVWRDRKGGHWFAYYFGGITMVGEGGSQVPVDLLLETGAPLSLVYRRESDGDQS